MGCTVEGIPTTGIVPPLVVFTSPFSMSPQNTRALEERQPEPTPIELRGSPATEFRRTRTARSPDIVSTPNDVPLKENQSFPYRIFLLVISVNCQTPGAYAQNSVR